MREEQTMRTTTILAVITCTVAAGLAAGAGPEGPDTPAAGSGIDRVLDDWHDAAASADEARYFGHFASDGIFVGTDDTERWTVTEFRSYAHPHFAAGRGWTYVPAERHVTLSPDGEVAWIDEKLDNDKYGRVRGSGVLRNIEGTWKLVHYVMSFPIPNELSRDVVSLVRGGSDAGRHD